MTVADVKPALAGDNKVGVIDSVKIVVQSQYANKLKAEFLDEMKEQQETLEKMRRDVEKQQQRLEDAKAAGKREEIVKKEE